jgi:hypothetical protein
MFHDVRFKLVPETFIVADLLAAGADWYQSAERLDVGKGFLKFSEQPFPLFLRPLAFGDIGVRPHHSRGCAIFIP